jgi:hypothetical protein
MAPLSKRDVEELLQLLDHPPTSIVDEVVGLRGSVATMLAQILHGGGAKSPWEGLVEEAAAMAGWHPERTEALLESIDLERARAALWDLATELNETRDLRPAPARGRDQREAVSAIERAIRAIADRDSASIRRLAVAIGELDGGGLYPRLPDALAAMADGLEANPGVPPGPAAIEAVTAALGPGPLAAELQKLAWHRSAADEG